MSKIDKQELIFELETQDKKHIVVTDDMEWKLFSEKHDGIFFMLDNVVRRKMVSDMLLLSAKYGNKLIVFCDYGFSCTSLRLPLMEEINAKKKLFGKTPATFKEHEVKIWEE